MKRLWKSFPGCAESPGGRAGRGEDPRKDGSGAGDWVQDAGGSGVHQGEQSLMGHSVGSVFLLRAVGNLSEILGSEGCVQSCILQILLLLCELKEVEIEEHEEPLHRLDKGEGWARAGEQRTNWTRRKVK